MSKPVFAMVGGLGHQGECTLHALANNFAGQFHFRVLGQESATPKAKTLKEKYGDDLEFVQGSEDNADDVDKLFHDADWAFVYTHPDGHGPAPALDEEKVGKAIADSAKKNGVKHLIFSTRPHAVKISGGKWSVPEFDKKAEVQDYILQLGIPAAFISPTFYYQKWVKYFNPRPNGDGTYSVNLPSAKDSTFIGFDVNETGCAVAHIVKHWDQWQGKTFTIGGDRLHPEEFVKIVSDVTGIKITYNQIPYEEFKNAVGEDVSNMLHFFEECGFDGTDAWQDTKKYFHPASFKEWAIQNADRLKPNAPP